MTINQHKNPQHLLEQGKLVKYVLWHLAAEQRPPASLFADNEWVSNVVARFNMKDDRLLLQSLQEAHNGDR